MPTEFEKVWEDRICPKCGSPFLRKRWNTTTVLCGFKCRRALTWRQVTNMRRAYENKWAGIAYLSRFYKLPPKTIWMILTYRRYKEPK